MSAMASTAADVHKRVLVAAETDELSKLLADLISACGHEALRAGEGSSGELERLAAQDFDLIVAGADLSCSEGSALLGFLAVAAYGHDCPLVVVSKDAGPVALEAASRLGARACLARPVDAGCLMRLVAAA